MYKVSIMGTLTQLFDSAGTFKKKKNCQFNQVTYIFLLYFSVTVQKSASWISSATPVNETEWDFVCGAKNIESNNNQLKSLNWQFFLQ